MRQAIGVLALFLIATVQAARADVNPNAAPADEYFGPYQQSVLEIRNRLNDYDQLAGSTMLDPSVGGYLDHLQLAIRDWQHRYPRDPWLPPMLAHLMREYWRRTSVESNRCGRISVHAVVLPGFRVYGADRRARLRFESRPQPDRSRWSRTAFVRCRTFVCTGAILCRTAVVRDGGSAGFGHRNVRSTAARPGAARRHGASF